MLDRIAELLGLSEGEVERRVAYVNLSEGEIDLLRELGRKVSEEEIAGLFDEFYGHLLSFEEIRSILEREEGLVERLKRSQAGYFRELLRGNYDLDYALSRLRVGYVHEKLGIEPKYYTGAFAKWVETVIPLIKDKVEGELLLPTLLALFKVVMLDVTISLDAYLFSKVIRGESEKYRTILNSVRDAVMVVDLDTRRIADLNSRALELLGLESEDEVLGRDALWIHPEELRPVMEDKFRRYLRTGEGTTEIEYVENKRSGEWIPVEISYAIFQHDGKRYLTGIFRDVRERLKREEVIRRLNKLYDTLSRINILTTTVSSEEELFSSAVRVLRDGGFRYAGIYRKGEERPLSDDGVFLESDTSTCIPLETGELYLLISRWSEEGFTREEIELLKEVAHDLSFALRKISMEEKLTYFELYDEVTQLPNRIYFLRRLAELVDKAKKERKEVALLLMDIDKFSELNEAFGHERVDTLLREIAGRLKRLIRGTDFLGRVGADEFGVVLFSEDAKNAVEKLLHRIREAFREPFGVDSTEIFITFSYGVSIFPEDVDTGERLFSNASLSLQRAKELGGNRTMYYSETARRETLEKIRLRSDLRKALDRGEFLLYYQPKIELKTGKVVGAEALIRWRKGDELIPPGKFIPVLEESELIHEVGEWVIREACRQSEEWNRKGIAVPVAVNVSPIQLKLPFFVENLYMVLSDAGGCNLLEIEITESAVMEDVERMIEILSTLTSRGIRTYIDDFGTGYSSLAYLKRLPVYALKIDRAFVKDIPGDKEDLEITKAAILLAQTFGLKTVAEGVETEEQTETLMELGCDFAQGYFFLPPVPPDEFERYFRERAGA